MGRPSGMYGAGWLEFQMRNILQDNDPESVLSGRDLPLEKAVETALKKIKEQPFEFPAVPRYPKK